MKPDKFPLAWPDGYPVTEQRQQSKFKCTFLQARDGMLNEFKLLIGAHGVRDLVISCNMPHDTKGVLTGKSPLMYPNPGVAVYFTFNGEEKVLACDHWKHLHENLRAIQLTVESLRSLERHKCTQILSRAMADLKALPAGTGIVLGNVKRPWNEVLGINGYYTVSEVKSRYRHLSKLYHPDNGSEADAEKFQEVQEAYKEALLS